MTSYPRVAFLPDTFHEVNGVAHTSRQLEAFARRREIPFLSIHCGPTNETVVEGPVTMLQLKRGLLRIGLDANLDYDPFLLRYASQVMSEVKKFGADVIHITGPGDMGAVGLYVSWRLQLPLVISWHTSLHEYAGRRLERVLGFTGNRLSRRIGAWAEKVALRVLGTFYRRAAVVMAPNQELIDLTKSLTERPVFLMRRGVNTQLFSPARRNRVTDAFRIGYVGRLTPEKNVRFLAELGNTLNTLGRERFEFMIVGEGSEETWLRHNVPHAIFTGVLRGERLAEAYANMDLFVFPSNTDTFGNVIFEALASGVPAVVTDQGGPKFLVQSGVTGHVASSSWDFITFVNDILTNSTLHSRMRLSARQYAEQQSWDNVFEAVFDAYGQCCHTHAPLSTSISTGRPSGGGPGVRPLLSSRMHERGRS
ncbi:MAG TPA: glycosyltransferase [Bryobacteraceae bacterium]|nr:glycosyltransferase [Bryobacteraceae bacterium]